MSMIDNTTRKAPTLRDVMPSMRAAAEEAVIKPASSLTATKGTNWRLRVSERRVVLAVVDILLVNLALIVATSLTGSLVPTLDQILAYNKWFIT